MVTGEGGIGKTRLVTELVRRAENAGARLAVGAGVDVGGEAPFAVWQELARQLVRTVPAPARRRVAAGAGQAGSGPGGRLGRTGVPPPVAAPELERLRIFDGALRLVEWAASGRPVLLVAEDVHRADRASLALTTHIGRRLAAMPVLLVLTRRDRPVRAEADALVADLAAGGSRSPRWSSARSPTRSSPRWCPAPRRCRAGRATGGGRGRGQPAARGGGRQGARRGRQRAAVHPACRGAGRDRALPPGAAGRRGVAAAGRAVSADEVAALASTDGAAERQVLDSGLVRRERGGLGFRHALLAEAARADLLDPESAHRVALAVEAAARLR